MTLTQLKYVITVAETSNMHDAAKQLFISQPALTTSIRNLEKELGLTLFIRSNNGIHLSPEGIEFVSYARQVIEQCSFITNKFKYKNNTKKIFSVSTQHFTFSVEAFSHIIKKYEENDENEYTFSIYETQTGEIIENVKNYKSEIGILYLGDFNSTALMSVFKESNLEYHSLFRRVVYAYLSKDHPLAQKEIVTLAELQEYPCLLYNQGNHHSAYFSEDILGTAHYKKIIQVTDRATAMDLLSSLNGYIIGSGMIGNIRGMDHYCVVKVSSSEVMDIGYIIRSNSQLTSICKKYIEELHSLIH